MGEGTVTGIEDRSKFFTEKERQILVWTAVFVMRIPVELRVKQKGPRYWRSPFTHTHTLHTGDVSLASGFRALIMYLKCVPFVARL